MAAMNTHPPPAHENPVFLYILEMLSACLICYWLYESFPQYNLISAVVYAAVVISPIREKSRALVISRIKANFLGAFLGFLAMLFTGPTFISLAIGAIAAILLCNALKIMDTARSALLTMVAVVIPHYLEPSGVVVLERIVSVTCGCLIALMITIAFEMAYLRWFGPAGQDEINAG